MRWAGYVLVDQALRGGGMYSTERPSSYIFLFVCMLDNTGFYASTEKVAGGMMVFGCLSVHPSVIIFSVFKTTAYSIDTKFSPSVQQKSLKKIISL